MATKAATKRVRAPDLDLVKAELASRHLDRFIREAWHVVEPVTPYKDNWHISAICEHLEAASRAEIRKLVINIPPRFMKSLGVTVFWPAWLWIFEPHRRWMFSSYALDLAVKHSVGCRRLIESPWYQERWGDRFQLAGDQNVKGYFENDKTGLRMASSVGAKGTGYGGDFVIVDDPHKVSEAQSDNKREGVIEWWDQEMSNRLNDEATGVRVIIMQRVQEGDLAGHVLEQDGWTHLCLPAEYEPNHPFVWPDDPRTEPGELLWPDKWGQEWLDEKKIDLGSYGYAGQYQQRPSPAEGGILQRAWWRYYETPPQMQEIVTSWDMSFKDSEGTDYVVGQVWGRDLANKYLLHSVRDRMDFPATCEAVIELEAWVQAHHPSLPHSILVEDKANGPAVMATLRDKIAGLIAVEPEGGKEARAHAAAPQIEAGNVYVPGKANADGSSYDRDYTPPWVQDFIEECAGFPRAQFDDCVDAMTQALFRMRGSGKTGRVRSGGYDEGHLSDA